MKISRELIFKEMRGKMVYKIVPGNGAKCRHRVESDTSNTLTDVEYRI